MSYRFGRFLLVGLLNTTLGYLIIFGGMYCLRMSPEASNVLGYSIVLLISFGLNRTFVFRSTGNAFREMVRFVATFLVAFAANLAVLLLLVRLMHVHEAASQVLAGVVYVACFYAMSRHLVFRQIGESSPES
jgi:putative flippase GtrA